MLQMKPKDLALPVIMSSAARGAELTRARRCGA